MARVQAVAHQPVEESRAADAQQAGGGGDIAVGRRQRLGGGAVLLGDAVEVGGVDQDQVEVRGLMKLKEAGGEDLLAYLARSAD